MRHAKPYRKLSRQRSHYRSLMRNLALALFEKERIQTTLTKAKEVRRFVDKIIGFAKGGTLADRRQAFALLGNITIATDGIKQKDPLTKVFGDIAKRVANRPGGYTRIIKVGYRAGDAAPMAILELVDSKIVSKTEEPKEEGSKKKPAAKAKAKTKKSEKAEAA